MFANCIFLTAQQWNCLNTQATRFLDVWLFKRHNVGTDRSNASWCGVCKESHIFSVNKIWCLRGSRRQALPCCGNARNNCHCTQPLVERYLSQARWEEFVNGIKNGTLMTYRDTQDNGPLIKAAENWGLNIVGQLQVSCVFRYFASIHTWQELWQTDALSVTPDGFLSMQLDETADILACLWSDPGHIPFGPGRRATPLQAVSADSLLLRGAQHLTETWPNEKGWLKPSAASNDERAARDTLALHMLLGFAKQPHVARLILKLSSDLSSETFALICDAWKGFTQSDCQGLEEYYWKCCLDVWLPLAGFPAKIVGHNWPVKCPGYVEGVRLLCPRLPLSQKFEGVKQMLLYAYKGFGFTHQRTVILKQWIYMFYGHIVVCSCKA